MTKKKQQRPNGGTGRTGAAEAASVPANATPANSATTNTPASRSSRHNRRDHPNPGSQPQQGGSNRNNGHTRDYSTRSRQGRLNHNNPRRNRSSSAGDDRITYPEYWTVDECQGQYALAATTARSRHSVVVIRGKLRVLPSRNNRNGSMAFVTCDRGQFQRDVLIGSLEHQNRALDGDMVYVEILPDEDDDGDDDSDVEQQTDLVGESNDHEEDRASTEMRDTMHLENLELADDPEETWQDDTEQMDLWNPTVPVPRKRKLGADTVLEVLPAGEKQARGRVVYVMPPVSHHLISELTNGSEKRQIPRRRIVGSLKIVSDTLCLLTPQSKSLPQFLCPAHTGQKLQQESTLAQGQPDATRDNGNRLTDLEARLYQAEYVHGSWGVDHRWPPCINLVRLGTSCCAEDEIKALLVENGVDHGEFPASVLKDVDNAVRSGLLANDNGPLEWQPTAAMYRGRRDYRQQRIFTIDPTTAKDLDDALHITALPDGRVEIGVHIADVSYFVRPGTAVDQEAQWRSTTVYLVDRTVPMLPRPLCEVACSLNENVERLAFSCVWRMNMDGTLRSKQTSKNEEKADNVWYGRTVIKSCARLDYATAQNIIDGKVATGEPSSAINEEFWPLSRRPTGGHTIDEVAADVRLMHRVAMQRRKLRFENGALALNGIKLTFKLDQDGETPLVAAPYPIRDSNRLVEEYMLLANYLVAQRLLSHAGGRAVLRYHPEPSDEGLDKVVAVAQANGYRIDTSSSQALHDSLCRLSRDCHDPLVLQSVTNMLMTPMQ
jgi:exoribonuclease R